MVNSCTGSLRVYPLDTTFVKKRHMGTLILDDDNIVFMFNDGKKIDIMLDEIDSIEIIKKMGYKLILIRLKNKKGFQFCSLGSSNWSATSSMLSGHKLMAIAQQRDAKNHVNNTNESIFHTIKYMIEKSKNPK